MRMSFKTGIVQTCCSSASFVYIWWGSAHCALPTQVVITQNPSSDTNWRKIACDFEDTLAQTRTNVTGKKMLFVPVKKGHEHISKYQPYHKGYFPLGQTTPILINLSATHLGKETTHPCLHASRRKETSVRNLDKVKHHHLKWNIDILWCVGGTFLHIRESRLWR